MTSSEQERLDHLTIRLMEEDDRSVLAELSPPAEGWDSETGMMCMLSISSGPFFTDQIDDLVAAGLPPTELLAAAQEFWMDVPEGIVRKLVAHGAELPPGVELPPETREEATRSWGERLWEAFDPLPDGLVLAGNGARTSLKATTSRASSRDEQLVERIARDTGHTLSERFLAFYDDIFKVSVHWHPVQTSYPNANFRLLSLAEMFCGGYEARMPATHSAQAELGFPADLLPELRDYFPLSSEEYGMTLLSLDDGKERLSFFESYGDKRIVPMTVDLVGYLEALLLCRGTYGWQSYFVGDRHRSAAFEDFIATHFGEQDLQAFLAMAS